LAKSKLTINLSRDEVLAHEIGPIIVATAKQSDLNIKSCGHIGTVYRKNPYNNGVDYIDSRFYNRENNKELHTMFVDDGQQDLWELKETTVDTYLEDDD